MAWRAGTEGDRLLCSLADHQNSLAPVGRGLLRPGTAVGLRTVNAFDHAVAVLGGNRLSEDRRPERRSDVGLRIADELQHVPVLSRLAFVVHSEDVDNCHPVVVGIVVDEVVEHAVGVHVVTGGDGAVVHEAGVLTLRRDLREVVDDPLGTVLEQGIVLDVIRTRVPLDRLLRPLLVDHHLVPSDDVLQVAHGSAVAGVDTLDHDCLLLDLMRILSHMRKTSVKWKSSLMTKSGLECRQRPEMRWDRWQSRQRYAATASIGARRGRGRHSSAPPRVSSPPGISTSRSGRSPRPPTWDWVPSTTTSRARRSCSKWQ